jgi:hypothetical protein
VIEFRVLCPAPRVQRDSLGSETYTQDPTHALTSMPFVYVPTRAPHLSVNFFPFSSSAEYSPPPPNTHTPPPCAYMECIRGVDRSIWHAEYGIWSLFGSH